MKKLFAITISLLSISSFASGTFTYKPAILDAVIDKDKETVTVTVKHGGGCGEHKYSITIGSCLETYPVQCNSAEIFDTTDDTCEALLVGDATFTFQELGLDDSYYNGASIVINGGKDYKNGKSVDTSASFQLPFVK